MKLSFQTAVDDCWSILEDGALSVMPAFCGGGEVVAAIDRLVV